MTLSQMIAQKDLVESEHMTTLLVVVPIKQEKEFLKGYETMENTQRTRREAKELSQATAKMEVSNIEVELEEANPAKEESASQKQSREKRQVQKLKNKIQIQNASNPKNLKARILTVLA
jgi:hypothetical protein